MSSPQSFVTVPAPNLQLGTPLIDFYKPQDNYYKARAENAFAGGIPMLGADGKPTTDPKAPGARPDYQAILSKTFQAGGVPAVQGLMPYLIYMGGLNKPNAYQDIATGGAGGQAPTPAPQVEAAPAHPAGAGAGNIAPQQSQASTQEQPKITGTGSEFDPYVIPKNEGSIKFFRESQAFANGAHFKIADTGWGGVKGDKGLVNLNTGRGTTTPPLGDKISPQMRKEQATTSPDASAGQAPDPMASARDRLAQRFQRGDQFGSPEQSSAQVSPVTTLPAPTGPTTEPPPGRAKIGAGPTGEVPHPGKMPAATSPPTETPAMPVRQPLGPMDGSAGDKTIADLQARQNKLSADIAEWGATNGPMKVNQGAIEAATQQINNMQKAIDGRRETLNKPLEKLNAARAEGFPSVQAKEAFDDATKKASEAGFKQLEAINGAAAQAAIDLEPHIANGKALLNSGKLYTGFGAETALEFNQAKQLWGDRQAAAPQEAFKKTVAAVQLGMANMQKFMTQIGGQNAGRLFAAQINKIDEASSSLGNTVAGNRFLLENAERSTKMMYDLQKMATKFIAAGNPYLNQDFNQQAIDYLRKNPLFKSDLEKSDPIKFMSAPEVPKEIAKQGGAALEKWQHDVGAKKGEPIRTPDGTYFKALQLKVPVQNYGPNPPGAP